MHCCRIAERAVDRHRHRRVGVSAVVCLAWVITVAVVGLTPAAAHAQRALTLADAIRHGLDSNEMYRHVRAEEERAQSRIKEVRSGILPDLRFESSYQRAFEIPTLVINGQSFALGSRHTANWGFMLEQSLWEGGRVLAAWAAARNYRRFTASNTRQAAIDLQAAIARAFFDALLAERLVEVAEQSLKVAEENFAVVDRKFAQGLVSEYDHLRAQVRVANLRPPLIGAENTRDLAVSRLQTLIGLRPGTPLSLAESQPDSSEWETLPLDQLIDHAARNRHDLVSAEYEVRILGNALSAARADYWPALKLRAGFNWQTFSDDFVFRPDDVSRNWSGTLTLSYPIFDGFRRSGSVGVARVDLKQARLRRDDLTQRVTLEIEQARNNFLESAERLDAQGETVAQAERGLDIANLRYESGVGTQLEVLGAQLDLTTARIQAEMARHDRLAARAEWRRAMGEPVLSAFEPE